MPRLKRPTVPWSMERKKARFVTAPRGAHRKDESIPLLVVIRDMLELGENAKEAKSIIKGREVKVDGRIMTDTKSGIGLFDVVTVGGKSYRMVPGKVMRAIEIPENEADRKVCKIIGKVVLKGGKIQLNLHDGRNMLVEEDKYSVNDSLLIQLPEQKIIDAVKFEPGILVIIISGKHSGKIAKLKKIEKGMVKRVWLETEGREMETPMRVVMGIGSKEPLIKTGE
ncbi:MAG: 30S ribosomal protein S4e [Candidatus Aenigmatarchaeota archaeon]